MTNFKGFVAVKLHNGSKGEKQVTMKKILLFILTISIVGILVACSEEEKLTVFKSDDSNFQVSATSNWKDAEGELNSEADLQIYSPGKEKYFMALLESKEDFTDSSLQSYYDLVTEPFFSSLDTYEQGDVKEVTINGNKALQYRLDGAIDNLNVVYMVTIIETPTHYGQLLAWTIKSKWDKNKDEYTDLINSFKEVN